MLSIQSKMEIQSNESKAWMASIESRMEAIEKKQGNPMLSMRGLKEEFAAAKELAVAQGYEANQTSLIATRHLKKLYGIEIETALLANPQEQLFTPTELGHIIGLSSPQSQPAPGKPAIAGKKWQSLDAHRTRT